MRAEAHQIEMDRIGLAINQNQIRSHVTVAMIFPGSEQGMVVMPFGQRIVSREIGHDAHELGIQFLSKLPFLFPPVIPLEGRGASNPPH